MLKKTSKKTGKKDKKADIKTRILVGLIVVILIGGAVGFLYMQDYYNEQLLVQATSYQSQITSLQSEINNNKKTVYLPIDKIDYGELITENNVQAQTIYTSSLQDTFITGEDFGSAARMDMDSSQPIYKSMVTKEDYDTLRETEITYVNLNNNLEESDVVDVRIKYANGEDYVVIAKTSMHSLNLGSAHFYLWLTEEDLLSLGAAAVDANLYGGQLYVTKYLDPSMQVASIVNYQPNEDVLKLMASDPNIVDISERNLSVQVRAALEARLNAFDSEAGDSVGASTTTQN